MIYPNHKLGNISLLPVGEWRIQLVYDDLGYIITYQNEGDTVSVNSFPLSSIEMPYVIIMTIAVAMKLYDSYEESCSFICTNVISFGRFWT